MNTSFRIPPASKLPYERVDSQDILLGDNYEFLDSLSQDAGFEDRMIDLIDGREDQALKEEKYLEQQLQPFKGLTDEVIQDILDNVTNLDRGYVATKLFFSIFNRVKTRVLTKEELAFVNARFFPKNKDLAIPVTYRAMKGETKKSVRTNFKNVASGLEKINTYIAQKYPMFLKYLTTVGGIRLLQPGEPDVN